MPKEPMVLCLSDGGHPRVFKMKTIPGHMDLQIQQEFTKFFPGGVQAQDWPKIWVKRFSVTTVEMKEDGVTEIPMNEERVASLPPDIYNRLQAEYLAIHQSMAENFLGNTAASPKTS